LPNAIDNAEKKTSTVEITIESLSQDINPAADILLQPYDIISVDRAERVYVSGEVGKVSAIELGERDSMSITQALTEAGGLSNFAIQNKVKILRPVLGTSRRAEIVVDMARVLQGKDLDYPLLPNDVLYVPRSLRRTMFAPTLPAGIIASLPILVVTLLVRR
jgi:protein involved in polysaccharide export with SLBB domain